MDYLQQSVPAAVTLAATILFLAVARRVLNRNRIRTGGTRIGTQLVMAALTFVGLLAILVVLPISEGTRGQLFTLIGILVSASIALSSSTIVGNAMAGMMIRVIASRRVRVGDFVIVRGHSGRVTEMGILATQIQENNRDLTWLPNQWIIEQPTTLVRQSGTILSTEVSLGYDLNHTEVEALLVEAADRAGLDNGFAWVQELGDHTVTYAVRGLLTDIDQLLQARGRLRAAILDTLHAAGIEILSPTFLTTRHVSEETQVIAEPSAEPDETITGSTREQLFDRAEEAAERAKEAESLRTQLTEALTKSRVATNRRHKGQLRREIQRLEGELAELDPEGP